jgi:uncharacterized protein (TIGR03085 family)
MPSLSRAYDDAVTSAPSGYPAAPVDGQRSIAQVERAMLCDYLDEVGPRRATLCDGWTTHHLVAHLAIREGSVVEQARNAMPGGGDRLVEEAVRTRDFAALVRQVRQGPSRLTLYGLPGADRLLNTLEFLIHHEDARRGEDGWEARELPTWVEDVVWGQVVKTAKLAMLRRKRSLTLLRSDNGEEAVVSHGPGDRLVVGLPSELALYVSGRKSAARVTWTR